MAKLSIQLYTIRDAMAKDYAGAFRALAKSGYTAVEGGGTGPLSTAEYKALMKELHIDCMGAHTGIDTLEGDKQKATLDLYAELGVRFLALSLSSKEGTADSWKAYGARLTKIGQACKAKGIQFQYHNHAHEFAKIGNEYPLEILLNASDPELVKSQLDIGWVTRAGENAITWMKKLNKRIGTIHLKDTTAAPDNQWTEVGTGILPLADVVKTGKELGLEWFIIEQDTCKGPSLDAAALSLANAKKAFGL